MVTTYPAPHHHQDHPITCSPLQWRNSLTHGQRTTEGAISIGDLLLRFGYASVQSQLRARQALEKAGLTNAKKHNISTSKCDRVRRLLNSLFVRTCDSPECIAAASSDGREGVAVAPKDCEICRGQRTYKAIRLLLQRLNAADIEHMLIVGGSPDAHTKLRRAFEGSPVELDLIDGTRRCERRRASASGERADVIIIWGNTILRHAVSEHFCRPAHREKTVVVARRGIEALACAVNEHRRSRSSHDQA